jgi:hypothetical protein
MGQSGCNFCEYLSKRPGAGSYFIYKCAYWGLMTQRVLPQSVVISSIGKRCPFFKERTTPNKKNDNKNGSGHDGLDIVI